MSKIVTLAICTLLIWGLVQRSLPATLLAILALVGLWRSRRQSDSGPTIGDTPPQLETDPGMVTVPVEDFLDLHTFSPADIPSVVESYIEAACAEGFLEVRLIHGKGKGVQRARVQSTLEKLDAVISFRDAPPERGGWGATIAVLRPVDGE